jgi:hypothetical protein
MADTRDIFSQVYGREGAAANMKATCFQALLLMMGFCIILHVMVPSGSSGVLHQHTSVHSSTFCIDRATVVLHHHWSVANGSTCGHKPTYVLSDKASVYSSASTPTYVLHNHETASRCKLVPTNSLMYRTITWMHLSVLVIGHNPHMNCRMSPEPEQ